MKICAISDTHGNHRQLQIPACDLIIFAGDFSNFGEERIVVDFNSWAATLSAPMIAIAGNHDKTLETNPHVMESFLGNVTYLRDSIVDFQGLKIYGSPMSPKVGNWAFGYRIGEEAKRCWQKVPDDIDILVTHGPPEGILDKGYLGDIFGCPFLLARVRELRTKGNLRAHFFGHIHEARGTYKDHLGLQYINASICNFPNMADIRQPTLVEV